MFKTDAETGTLKLYFKNVIVLRNVTECVKLTFSGGTSVEYHNVDVT